ncbi:hypothetical protein BDF14DRAFT_1878124 [Spinellus fusiger]|nr:hypothetical protein BDF14DRAFT_1878124 [Spinellus fusiger]
MSENSDNLTHPLLYRNFVNNKKNENCTSNINLQREKTEPVPIRNKEQCSWDLYPNMIREIENKGTPEQVKQLHEMELFKN